MAMDSLVALEVIEALENFIDEIRPPEEMRDQFDISYKIDDQSVIIYEVREHWDNKKEKIESPIAKTTYVIKHKHWKVFWLRADLKWHTYEPKPIVNSIQEFVQLVEEDDKHCFWG